jgi:hypothetical protein
VPHSDISALWQLTLERRGGSSGSGGSGGGSGMVSKL